MRRCYLHFGTPKTGSTTIQQFLHDHGPSLLKFGYLVPTASAGSGGSHLSVVRALSRQQVPFSRMDCVSNLLDQISYQPNKDILLSTEVLESLFKRQRIDNPVVSFFRRNGFDVVLVGYFRNQPQRINSGYAQAVKSLQTDITFEARVRRFITSSALDYTLWSRFAAENGCELLARPFNRDVRSAGIIEDFLSTLGIQNHDTNYSNEMRANRSPGPCALAAVLEVYRRAEQRGHRWTNRQRVHAKQLLTNLISEPQFAEIPFCGLDTKLAREIQAFYRPSNDRFAEAVWGTDWATVFKEDVEAEFERNQFDPATASPEEKERFAAILDRLWPGMQKIMNNPRLQSDPEKVPAEFE